MDHLEKGTLDLSELRFLVLDEADEMLNMGFAEDVETILADTPDEQAGGAVLGDDAARRSAGCRRSTCTTPSRSRSRTRPRPSANTTQRYLIVSYPQKVDALTRILEVENFEGDDRVRPHEERDRDARREAARARLLRDRHQRRRRPGAARAHRQPAQVRQARHPGGDRRRRSRPRRRTHQPRRELRHPDRHRVLRPPHRPHGPRRAQRAMPSPS